jgi:epoxyqueuosine reductase
MDRIRELEPSFAGRAFVDSAPVMERSLAAASGLGWVGQNGCLVVPGLGSYVLLAEIVCNLSLPPGKPLPDQCDECGRCAAASPTSAFLADGLLDCRRCISYLTIEHRGPIEPQYWRRIGVRVLGCDACQEACPQNKDIPPGDRELIGDGRPLGGATIRSILGWTEADWDEATRGSAARRATHDMFVRNAILAAGNSGDRSLIEPVRALRLASGHDPAMIDWAVEHLSEEED